MWFKIFQLLLRWFPAFQRWVKKRRSKNSLLHRTAFNEAFSEVKVDENGFGSIHSPIQSNDVVGSFLGKRLKVSSPAGTKFVYFRLKFSVELEALTGRKESRSVYIGDKDLERLDGLVGSCFSFRNNREVLYILLKVMPENEGIIKGKRKLLFLEVKPEGRDIFDVFTPTLRWEAGAIPKKKLPVTHILRTKQAQKMIKKATNQMSESR